MSGLVAVRAQMQPGSGARVVPHCIADALELALVRVRTAAQPSSPILTTQNKKTQKDNFESYN